jgi:hypothetical protein
MAERQAQAMAQSGTMSHDVIGAFSSRLAGSEISSAAGENLGEGYMSFDEAFSGWRSSAGHDANLLMPDATRFGIALAKNQSAAYGAYWAMVVAAEQRTALPASTWLAPFPRPSSPTTPNEGSVNWLCSPLSPQSMIPMTSHGTPRGRAQATAPTTNGVSRSDMPRI